ncbi:MAG: HlyC/CorC family transporter [Chloroflexi bacterium]|nr:HlyC/CorC family transporter [Chloroflexota bacterium]
MNDGFWFNVAGFVACALVLGVASTAQAAFSHLNAARLRSLMQHGVSRSEALAEVAQDPSGLAAAISIAHLGSVAGAVGLATVGIMRLELRPGTTTAILIGVAILLLTVQTLGRAIGSVRPEPVAARLYILVRMAGVAASPLVRLENLLVRSALRPLLGGSPEEREATTEEDLRLLVDTVEETQALEREERAMITSIFEMSDRDVSEIMVPRLDVVAIDASTPIVEALDLAISTGHSRFPVIQGDLDHLLGIVHLRDLAGSVRSGTQEAALTSLTRSVHVIPESKKIDELLRDLQTLHIQMAMVVDEYGGTAGLVTIEDLVEEIVGEIRDEYDTEEDRIQVISDHEAIMDARVSIHDANEVLALHLDDEHYENLAGLVYSELGRVPALGDVVTLPNCRISVLATSGRRVHRVQVILTDEDAADR